MKVLEIARLAISNASNLSIAENSAIGTVIGEFNATDPDGDTNITFSLVPPLPSDLNLSLWLDASDASTITQSNGSVSQWADKSGNDYHFTQSTSASQPKTNTINIGGNNAVDFDGTKDMANSQIPLTRTHSIFVVCSSRSTGFRRIITKQNYFYLGIL